MHDVKCINGWGVSSMTSFQLGGWSSVIKCCQQYIIYYHGVRRRGRRPMAAAADMK